MKIAVTGGTGFIGSHVVDHLVDAGHDVSVIDLRSPHRPDVGHSSVDIADLDGLLEATAGCDAVFHLAAFADVNDVAADPVGATDANVLGTAKVWEACRQNGVKRAILASTVWVYGVATNGDGALTESTTFDLADPTHLYTSSKLAAEMVAQSYLELFGVDYTILRYGIPYGPRMRPALVIPKFVTMALNGDPITVHGDGSQHRNYVYVEDLAEAHVLCLEDAAANQVLNLEGSERVTIRRLVDSISTALDREVQVSYSDARTGDYEGREISAAKAGELIGWRPTVPFEEGLRRYVDWHLDTVVAPAPVVAAAPVAAAVAVAVAELVPVARWRSMAAGCAAGTAILPILATAARGTQVDHALGLLAVFAGLATLTWLHTRRRSSRLLSRPVGGVALVALVWLVSQAPWSWELLPLGVLLAGVAAGTFPRRWVTRSTIDAGLATAAGLAAVQAIHPAATNWAAAAVGLGGIGASASWYWVTRRAAAQVSWRWSVGTLVLTGILGSWVGATSANASWFGALVTHGSRTDGEVALTFDGQPANETRSVLRILGEQNVKGTFFTSGDSVRTNPQLARELVQNGELLGDAGYSSKPGLLLEEHPAQLDLSQRTFAEEVGVCPSYVRPPRGVHTPLTARLARSRSMKLVTWDVGRFSRSRHDGARLAAAVLSSVKPGSIISLSMEDPADASSHGAVSAALPLIIQGLRERHLQPVRLDDLLGAKGYAGRC